MKTRSYILNIALIATTAAGTYFITPLISDRADAQQSTGLRAAVDNEYQAGATLWMQKSAEYRAIAYQAFNWAKIVLDEDEKNSKKLPKAERKRTRAIVVDIDETVLDNSPSQAQGLRDRTPFSLPSWYAWGDKRSAKAIPGSVEFLNYATSKGVKVFYVSNRDEVQKKATMDNLVKVGFQGVTNETVMLRQNVSTKTPRRDAIAKDHRIVILMGDNLDDFSDVFERKSIADRFGEVDKIKSTWGHKFIVLPNAMYGTWENAIYEYRSGLTDEQKTQKRVEALVLP